MVYGVSVPTAAFDAVTVAGGIRLRYAHQGPSRGPAVLMLHGYSDSWFSFSRVLPLMASHYRIIVPDQRGHGGSDAPESGYSVDDFALDALELMDGLRVRQATLVGHSFGSFVARRVAALAPDRVERLVLIGTAPVARNAVVEGMRPVVDALTDPVDPEFVREFQLSTIHRMPPPEFMERVITDSGRVPVRVWRGVLDAMMNSLPDDSAIRCPTLVLGGQRDAVFSPSEQEAMARQIPGAVVKIFPDIGHDLQWEDPDLFVREFKA